MCSSGNDVAAKRPGELGEDGGGAASLSLWTEENSRNKINGEMNVKCD